MGGSSFGGGGGSNSTAAAAAAVAETATAVVAKAWAKAAEICRYRDSSLLSRIVFVVVAVVVTVAVSRGIQRHPMVPRVVQERGTRGSDVA